ncbi:Ig-like domain-containing protein [Bacillus sinesaloumensis]|uniref:Ig-like domain-containing protein n=1 Tax=Litchfieldia sinesaloumensis TaxID=1926280 RepID=UPI001356410A|nr:Ig-like domain-containing protein [Bacillus sinesaloumensis]
MISRSYRKNKSVFWLPIAFVLVLSVVLFSLNVSSQVESKQFVKIGEGPENQWEIGQDFSKEWYINATNFEFQVDLSIDYQNYLDKIVPPKEPEQPEETKTTATTEQTEGTQETEDTAGQEESEGTEETGTTEPSVETEPIENPVTPPGEGEIPEGENPFEVKVKEGPGTATITPITVDGVFKGLYKVSVTDLNKDGKITFDIDFKSDTWVSEPPTKNTEFYVTKDVNAPVVELSGPEDGKYYDKPINLGIKVNEEHFLQDGVDILVMKDGSKLGIDSVQWNENNEASLSFDQVGEYEVTVTATDKAGNVGETKSISFANVSWEAEMSIKDKTENDHYKDGVTIEIKHPLSIKTAQLTYKKDGGEPQTVKLIENGLFVKKATHTLAEEGTYEISAVVTDYWRTKEVKLGPIENIIVDNTPPALEITEVANGGKYTESKEMVVSATDTYLDEEKSVLKLTKNGEVETIRGKAALEERTLSDGVYNVELRVYDKAGNETVSPALNFTIDTQNPVVSIDGVENGKFYPDDQTVHFTVEDLTVDLTQTTLIVKHNDTDFTEEIPFEQDGTKGEASYTFSAEGKYTLELNSTDQLGNAADTVTKAFTIDKTKPTVSFEGVENNKKYNEQVNVAVVAEDTNKDDSSTILTVTKDDKTTTYKGDKAHQTHSFKQEGVYEIHVAYFDKAGNKAESTTTFIIDTSNPEVDITGVSDNEYSKNDKEVKFTVEDWNIDLDQIDLTITKDGNDYPTEDIKFKKHKNRIAEAVHTFTDDGVYVATLKSTDEAGNTSALKQVTFTIDKIAPEIVVTNIGEDGRYNDDRDVTITVTDLNMGKSTATVKYNGESYEIDPLVTEGKMATTKHMFTEEGVYELEVVSTDKAGNEAREYIKFTVDKTGPAIKYSIEDGTYFNDNKVNLTVTVDDYTPFVPEITVNGEVLEESWIQEVIWFFTQKLTISFEDENVYSVQVKAKDYFGAESKKDLGFTIDRTPPEIHISGDIPHEGFVQGDNELIVDINDTHFDDSKHEVLVNGKAVENAEWKKTDRGYQFKQSFPEDGVYEVIVHSEDFAGNKSVEKKHKFTVDNVKPVIDIEDVKDGSFYDKKQTATVKVNELNFANNEVNIEVTKNGGPYSIGKWNNQGVTSSLAIPFNEDGDYVIKVTSKDAAGNIAETKQVKFTVDETHPTVKITGVEHMTNYNVTKQVSFEVTDANIDQTSLRVTRNGQAYDVGAIQQSRTKASLTHNFAQEGSYVLYFNATDKSGNKTTHDEIAFIIDKTNPVVKIDGVDHQSFNPTGKRVTVSVDELNFGTNYVVLSVTKDGKVFNIGKWENNNKLSSLGYNFNDDGLYTVGISAEDKAGNGPITANKTFTIDTTKPAIEITGVENAQHYNVDKPVNIEIRDVNLDVNRVTVTRNGRGYNAGGFAVANQTARLSHNFSQEGDYSINVEAIDKAGNQFSRQIAFTIDKTAPVITPKFKGQSRIIKDGEFINEVFTPEFALDQAEDTIVSATMNGSNVTGRIPTASLEMKYEYSVLARDKAGNESTINISFTLDTTKPNLSITGVIDGFFNNNQAPTVTYSDRHLDSSRSSVTLNGRPFENGVQLADEGDYILKAEIYDLANNVSSRTIVFTIDKTAPVIRFKEAISDQYFNESLIPELLIEDLNNYDIISLTLNGQPYNLGDPIEDEGKHVLFFEVKDQAGNIQQLSVEFIIDKTPPNVIVDGVEKNETYRDPVTFSISLDNPSDTLKSVMINGELFDGDVKEVNGLKVVTVSLSDIDQYKVEVVAFDEAGNEINEVVEFEIVEKSVLVKFYENKPLFAGSMIGLVGVAAAGAVALRRSIIRRRDAKDM